MGIFFAIMPGAFSAAWFGSFFSIVTATVILVLAVVDLRTRRGRLIALEAVVLGFIAINLPHEKHSFFSLACDAIALMAAAVILRYAEGPSTTTRATSSDQIDPPRERPRPVHRRNA